MLKIVVATAAILLGVTAHAEARSKPYQRFVTKILPHPAGCPTARFCGCGVMKKVGLKDRRLYLAANWLRFKRTKPRPGMVAARHGHVFYIVRVLGNGKVLAYDPNSGGRKTRLHARSLRGFTVVNPRA